MMNVRSSPSVLSALLCGIALGAWSCRTGFYQVFETKSPDTPTEDNQYVHENRDVRVTYDFWGSGGNMGFTLFNKLDTAIYLDLGRCHFIHNGTSYDYWSDMDQTNTFHVTYSYAYGWGEVEKIVTGSASRAASVASARTQGHSTTTSVVHRPKRILHIPPHSSVRVGGFHMIDRALFDCDFNVKGLSMVSKDADKGMKKREFDIQHTPLSFRNYLEYGFDEVFSRTVHIENSFYLSTIIIVNEKIYIGKSLQDRSCKASGSPTMTIKYERPYKKPTAFFFKWDVYGN